MVCPAKIQKPVEVPDQTSDRDYKAHCKQLDIPEGSPSVNTVDDSAS